MRRPTRRGDTRETILAAATTQFARHGYNAVGLRAIADAVGVQPASVYHHFAGKEDLLYAITAKVTKDFVMTQLPLLDGDGLARDLLGQLVRTHIVYFWEHRDAMAVALNELDNLSPDHHAEVQSYRRRYQNGIRDLISTGVGRNEFHTAEPRLVTLAILDMVHGINRWFREDLDLSIEELADRYAYMILQLLLGARVAG